MILIDILRILLRSFIMFPLFIGILFGCKSSSPNANELKISDNNKMHTALGMPYLGDPAIQQYDNPYDENEILKMAYENGFVSGWKVIQRSGRGAMVSPPLDYLESERSKEAWNKGFVFGKKMAVQAFQRLSSEE